ncbi:MAG: undecaprenyl-diphosphatase [Candidatus Doudnabacteria bacterium]
MHQFISRLDYKIFNALNTFPNSKLADALFIFMAVYLAYILVILIAIYWFINKDRFVARKAVILAGVSGSVARYFFASIIRALYHRDRPYIRYQNIHELVSKNDTAGSFPSGHATAMFAIASLIYFYNRKLGTALYIMAVLTGISRVVVGVHYPSDIVAGALIGIGTGYLVYKVLDRRIEPLVTSLSALSDKILPFTKSK